MNKKERTVWLVIALSMLAFIGCMTVPNKSPSPILVPHGLNENDVENAILFAIADKPPPPDLTPGQRIADNALSAFFAAYYEKVGSAREYWYFEDRADGVVYAGFQDRRYYMRTAVHYDAEKVRMEILESRNLRQNYGYIHKKAFDYLMILESRIRRLLGQIATHNASQ